ncbi:MAG: BMP family lipoprotein [Pleomorphochaeta sp.]
MKKMLIALTVLVTLMVPLFANGAKETASEDDGFSMVMVTNVTGLGDEGFNDAAWKGMQRAEQELGASISVIETGEQSQYVPGLQTACEQGYDIVVAVGFLLLDAVTQVSAQYPDTNFIMIDGYVDADNVASVLFKENEAAYLSGIIAAMTTESGKVGFIGGMEQPAPIRFESGWKAGVASVDPSISNTISYVGSFGNPGAGKEQASLMYKQGIDVIQLAAGGTEVGCIEAAVDNGKWVIPCDKDKSDLAGKQQLTASIKKIDEAVMAIASEAAKGSFPAGKRELGLAEGAVGYPESVRSSVSSDILAVVDDATAKIISGEIVVPSTRDQYAAFVAPSLVQ